MKDQATRTAVMDAIDVDQLVKQTYFGRGKIGAQMYPPYVLAADHGKQTVAHDPSAQPYSDAGAEAEATGCWLNVADTDDLMVAQPWLKGVEQAHAVSNPNSLRIAPLTVG